MPADRPVPCFSLTRHIEEGKEPPDRKHPPSVMRGGRTGQHEHSGTSKKVATPATVTREDRSDDALTGKIIEANIKMDLANALLLSTRDEQAYNCLTSAPAFHEANFARTLGVIWVLVDFAAATNAECGT